MYTFYEIFFACAIVFGVGGAVLYWLIKRGGKKKVEDTIHGADDAAADLFKKAEAKIKEKLEKGL